MSAPRLRFAFFTFSVLALAALVALLAPRTAAAPEAIAAGRDVGWMSSQDAPFVAEGPHSRPGRLLRVARNDRCAGCVAAPAYDCGAVTSIPQIECEALVALYNATGGENWGRDLGWLQTQEPCGWYGVTCDGGRVKVLEMLAIGLVGPIPSEIGDLTGLTALTLSFNRLSSVPPEIGSLSSLTGLALPDNQLTSLPPEIGNLTSLTSLALSSNQFSSLPPEIGALSSLTELNLEHNQLGSLPPEIGSLGSLVRLNLGWNQLDTLPPEIGKLTDLISLDLQYNQLRSLPLEIWNLSGLTGLLLSGNQLTSLPPQIGSLSGLTSLGLSGNQLTSLPGEIGKLNGLKKLILEHNQLRSLPPEIGDLTNLTSLPLTDNLLTGLPPEIWKLPYLRSLSLSDNLLTSLPPQIGNLTSVSELDLSGNQVSSLPPEIGNLRLEVLDLSDNPLSGPLPGFLTSQSNLKDFSFYDSAWCVPADDPSMLAWLANVYVVTGTGFVCGQPPGGLSGRVTGTGGGPLAGVSVALYRQRSFYEWGHIPETVLAGATTTDAAGVYRFGDLGQGIAFRLHFASESATYAPEYYDDMPTFGTATHLYATLGITQSGIDARLDRPPPPLATITATVGTAVMGAVSVDPVDGTVFVSMVDGEQADVTVRSGVTCESGQTPDRAVLTMAGLRTFLIPAQDYPMAPVGNGMYEVTIPASDILGDAELEVELTCDGQPGDEFLVGTIDLYKPSGVISDAKTGAPLAGATVTLYQVLGWLPRNGPADTRPDTCESTRSKALGAPWSQPAPQGMGVIASPDALWPYVPDPELARQQTDAGGRYGWRLYEGCWYVRVTAPGYAARVSPVVGTWYYFQASDVNVALSPLDHYLYLPAVRH